MAVRKKGSPLVLGIIFAAVGIGVLVFGIKIREKGKETLSWTEAPGIVVYSEIDRSRNSDGKTMYSATIEAEYIVGGETYVTDRLNAGGKTSSSSRDSARKVIQRYPKGKTVPVFYNPDDYGDAVLEPGVPLMAHIMMGVGALFGGVGVCLFAGSVLKGLFVAGVLGASLAQTKKNKKLKSAPQRQPSPSNEADSKGDDGFSI
ncbi:MAG TPA: DUF3592 domain-containing protein [Tichowtungia sp.]|nr:DUF3592 domain-containing protein [Tichowtungia sp.]